MVKIGLFDKLKQQFQSKNSILSENKVNHPDSSTIPDEELKFYQPEAYYTIKTHEDTPFEFKVLPFEARKKNSYASVRGLFVPEILMLSFCSKFPNPKNGYPGYWWFKYGVRDVGGMLRTLESRGFIEIDPEKGKYRTTPLGELEIKENEYIVYTHRNSDLTDFTAWELNQLLGSGDKSSWMKLFCEHTGKLPPLDIKKEKIEKTNLDNPLRKIKPRVSLSQIKNKNNWEKGYDEGSPFYYKGEQFRKAGDLYGAIELYDKARFYGYNAPALYTAYAMAFRKLKDYENEIAVLEEGMMRDTSSGSNEKLAERKSRAVELRDQERKKGL